MLAIWIHRLYSIYLIFSKNGKRSMHVADEALSHASAFVYFSFPLFVTFKMLAADEIPNTIYAQVFETDQKRPFGDTEPLLIDALEPTRSLSFNTIHNNARAFASALRSTDYGIKQGDVVAICSPSDVSISHKYEIVYCY